MPSLSRPMELSMPPVVSTVRGGGLPGRGSWVIVLGRTAPRRECRPGRPFPGIAERARGHGDRVGQAQPAQLDVETDGGGAHGHFTFSASQTASLTVRPAGCQFPVSRSLDYPAVRPIRRLVVGLV